MSLLKLVLRTEFPDTDDTGREEGEEIDSSVHRFPANPCVVSPSKAPADFQVWPHRDDSAKILQGAHLLPFPRR